MANLKTFKNFREELVDERASLVMDIPAIIKVMLKDVQTKLEKELRKGKTEIANNVGRLVGLKVTTKGQKKNKSELSTIVAETLAKKANEKNIKKIYFDRGIYKYHGRVKIFAETLRKNGMEF